MQRSILVTAESPHTWAMSVAFDDHGEVVPIRGVTKNVMVSTEPAGLTRGPSSSGPYASSLSSCDASVAESGRWVTTRWIQLAVRPRNPGHTARPLATMRACLATLSAARPGTINMTHLNESWRHSSDQGKHHEARPPRKAFRWIVELVESPAARLLPLRVVRGRLRA